MNDVSGIFVFELSRAFVDAWIGYADPDTWEGWNDSTSLVVWMMAAQ